jgi:ubiquitin-conjugating enzyme E2 variant
MLKIHWLRNNTLPAAATVLVLLAAWVFEFLTWQVVVFAVLAGFAQQAHRFSHSPRILLPRIVVLLQRAKILQDGRHHWGHHKPPHLTRYCALTPWLNPVLDRIQFWRVMDRLFVPVFGAPRRLDLRKKSWYRDHAFWA